jgi:hypothetical protein
MTPEVSKLLEQALSLSVEEQEALANSLISNLGGQVDEGVRPGKSRSGSESQNWNRARPKHFLGGSAPAQFGEVDLFGLHSASPGGRRKIRTIPRSLVPHGLPAEGRAPGRDRHVDRVQLFTIV